MFKIFCCSKVTMITRRAKDPYVVFSQNNNYTFLYGYDEDGIAHTVSIDVISDAHFTINYCRTTTEEKSDDARFNLIATFDDGKIHASCFNNHNFLTINENLPEAKIRLLNILRTLLKYTKGVNLLDLDQRKDRAKNLALQFYAITNSISRTGKVTNDSLSAIETLLSSEIDFLQSELAKKINQLIHNP